jgi:hypothetical protein
MVKTLCINGWYGRLGNNIIQVKNALHIAFYYGYNVIIQKHQYFKYTHLKVSNTNEGEPIEPIYDYASRGFYFVNDIDRSINRECFSTNYDKVREVLLSLFVLDYRTLESLGEDELVIHIRSGDSISVLHDQYIIPPLSYYTKFIDRNNFKKIYILAEDTQNLCIESLKKTYSNVEFELRSLKDDIELVLRARNMMMSIGSFIPELIWVTKHTRNVIYPSYDEFVHSLKPLENMVPNVKLTSIDLTEYYNEVKSANDTKESRMSRSLNR